jgi:hypothetical protein
MFVKRSGACLSLTVRRLGGEGVVDLAGHELRLGRERVGELEVDRSATGREVDQRRVGEAHVDPAGERGDGWIGALDQTVVSSRRMIKPLPGTFSGSTLLRSTDAPGTVASSALSAARTCSALLAVTVDYETDAPLT